MAVRTAAADALKKIDEQLHELAVSILVNNNIGAVATAAKLENDGEPLVPAILHLAKLLSQQVTTRSYAANQEAFSLTLTALVRIDKADKAVNKLVLDCISPKNRNPYARLRAVTLVTDIKDGKKGLSDLLLLAKTDQQAIRLKAIEALVAIADETNNEKIAKTLEGMRYDLDPAIRKAAVETADKLNGK